MAKENKSLEQLKTEAEQAQKVYEDAKKAVAQKEAEEAARKQAELIATREMREAELEEAGKKFEELLIAYNKDYGPYKTNRRTSPYLWRWFI